MKIKIPNSKKKEPECKGLFFKAHVNSYLSSYKSIEFKKSLRLLKRKSCPGCSKCDWIFDEDDFKEYLSEFNKIEENIEDQKIYELVSEWSPGPWEYPDDGEMNYYLREVRKTKEIKPNCLEIFDHYNPCPECGSQMKAKTLAEGSGIECPNKKCDYWCY